MFKRGRTWWAYVDGKRVSLKEPDFDQAKKVYDRLTGGEDIRKKPIEFAAAVKEYKDSVRFQAGLAADTQKRYSWCFDKCLIPYFKGRAISKIRSLDVERYIEMRKTQGAAPNTILKDTTALSALFRWCVSPQGYLTINVVREVKKPSNKDLVRPNYTPTEKEINQVLENIHKTVITFFLVLCNTGARVNELRTTNVSDFDHDLGTLRVVRKGGAVDVLVLNDIAKNRITDDLLERALIRDVQPNEPLFLNRYKTRLLSIRRSIKFACERAKVPHMSHHSLRHGYATILYEQGYEIPIVANLLANSIEVCTEIYIKWRNRKQKDLARNIQIGTDFVQSTKTGQS